MYWHADEIEWMWDMFPGKYAQCRVFALLYGLTQNGKGWKGSNAQLARVLRMSTEGVRKILADLENARLIAHDDDHIVVTTGHSVAPLPPEPPITKINKNKKTPEMDEDFLKFWTLFSPAAEYTNRQQACATRWREMSTWAHDCIFRQFKYLGRDTLVKAEPNPYYFLSNWKPPRPQFYRSGKEQMAILAAGYGAAYVELPKDSSLYERGYRFAWMVLQEARFFGFPIKQVLSGMVREWYGNDSGMVR